MNFHRIYKHHYISIWKTTRGRRPTPRVYTWTHRMSNGVYHGIAFKIPFVSDINFEYWRYTGVNR